VLQGMPVQIPPQHSLAVAIHHVQQSLSGQTSRTNGKRETLKEAGSDARLCL
jgi:hypothetical protein